MNSDISYDGFFMSLVYFIALKSKDNSSKIGAVIVGPDKEIVSVGWNGLPRKVNECILERHERPLKYSFFAHAERNCIYNCVRIGVSAKGCSLFTNGTPCSDCGIACIQAGIKEVIVHKKWEDAKWGGDNKSKWLASADITKQMFLEAGVSLRQYDGPLLTEIKGYCSGNIFNLN